MTVNNFKTESEHPHVDTKSEEIAEEFNEPPVAGKVVDKVDEHTPANPDPSIGEAHDPSDGRDKLKPLMESVAALATQVNILTNLVADTVKDEKVNKHVPWTHRGGNR